MVWRLAGSAPFRTVDVLRRIGPTNFGPTGPMWLSDARIAQTVVEAIVHGYKTGRYILHAYVLMPNHAHSLLSPMSDLSRTMRWLKGRTARKADRILGRVGEPFWRDESHGHWIQSAVEFKNTIVYIESNPVRSDYIDRAEQYRWSSAYFVPQATKNDGLWHAEAYGD